MIRVYCTKKLQDFIGNVEQVLPADMNNIVLSDWNAHMFFLDKRKCLIFVNNLTFYTVFIIDVLKRDIKNLNSIFLNRFIEQLVNDKVIEAKLYIKHTFSCRIYCYINGQLNYIVL